MILVMLQVSPLTNEQLENQTLTPNYVIKVRLPQYKPYIP